VNRIKGRDRESFRRALLVLKKERHAPYAKRVKMLDLGDHEKAGSDLTENDPLASNRGNGGEIGPSLPKEDATWTESQRRPAEKGGSSPLEGIDLVTF